MNHSTKRKEKEVFESLFKKYDRIVFFDTETTGFDSDKDDQIIEIGRASCRERVFCWV